VHKKPVSKKKVCIIFIKNFKKHKKLKKTIFGVFFRWVFWSFFRWVFLLPTLAIGRLVNGKFTATIVAPRLDSLELAVDRGKMSEEVLGRLRDRIGVRSASVAASRSGFLQICVDR
jgi:hypothetical protein